MRLSMMVPLLVVTLPLVAAEQRSTPDATANQRLVAAAQAGNLDAISQALREGASVNAAAATSNGSTPLLPLVMAAIWDRPAAVRALLEAGANPTPALSRAGCKPSIVTELLNHGADPNSNEYPLVSVIMGIEAPAPLLSACVETARLMVIHGATVNRIGDGPSPFSQALAMNSRPFIDLFLANGADINARGSADMTPLQVVLEKYAVTYKCVPKTGQECGGSGPYLPLISYLLEHGANPNTRDPDRWDDEEDASRFPYLSGYTALGLAARYNWYAVAQLLLKHGADPAIPRQDGTLPAEIAKANGHQRTAELIQAFSKVPAH
jgi:ankyrin repeat protein